jgi:branched-subunit amino acid aminotransferase/4-amino-4-deoxychorismate lyase
MTTEPIFYVSGDWVPKSRAFVHVFDSGLMYGDTITETLRTFRRKPYEVNKHLARMRQSLHMARIDIDPSLQLDVLVDQLVERNRGAFDPADELLLKIDITRGVFGYYREPGDSHPDFNLIMHVIRLPFHKFARNYDDGIAVTFPQTRQMNAQCLDPRIKHRSRIFQAIAEREANEQEPGSVALLLDAEGRLAEGTGWNVFLARDGGLLTPSSDNCLEGVSRAVVIELCSELGIECHEAHLRPFDLATADEAFATATSYCIQPITRAQGRAIGTGRPGPLTARLLTAWSERVGVDIARQARELAAAQQGNLVRR